MSSYSNPVISDLNLIIDSLSDKSLQHDLIYHPDKHFVRSSKFCLVEIIRFVLGSGPTTLRNELRKFCQNFPVSVTPSAIVQSRAKIKPELFQYIFDTFNHRYACTSTYQGYRIIAVDGTKVNIAFNSKDPSSTHHGKPKADGNSGKGYNQVHMSAAYDVLNDRFIDSITKDIHAYDERREMIQLVDHYDGEKAIWMADRGYEGANIFEVLNKKVKYLIRSKDIDCGNGLTTGLNLPEGEFDIDVKLTFTNLNRKQYQLQKSRYKIIQKSQTFDFLDEDIHFYDVTWRIVRFKVYDNYEVLITNLEREEFDVESLKYLYGLRWQIETAFRYLKQDVNLHHFISRKKDYIRQEIWAKLTMYNLSSIIRIHLEMQRKEKKKKKHIHMINFSNAIHLIVSAFPSAKRKGGIPPDLDIQIINETSPVRENRRFSRLPRPHSYVSSNYRAY